MLPNPFVQRAISGRHHVNPGRLDGPQTFEQRLVTCDAEDPSDAHAQREDHRAQSESAGGAADDDACPGPSSRFPQCRICGSKISKARSSFIRDGFGQLDQRRSRRRHVFREAGIGVIDEHLARTGTEPEIAEKCVGIAVDRLSASACMAGAARRTRVNVHPVARLDGFDLVADVDDLSGRIQSVDGRQRRERQERKPFRVVRHNVLHVGNDPAGLHFDQNVVGAWFRNGDLVDGKGRAHLVKAGGFHGGHAEFLPWFETC